MTKMLTMLFAALFAFASQAATPTGDDAHAHHSHGDTLIAPPSGQRWPTDEHLRAGMNRIESAVEKSTAKRPLEQARAQELARLVEQNVRYLIEHCKLPPEPDAALHGLIGRLMTAANQLKQESSQHAAIEQIESTLHDYHETFEHTETAAPAHSHSHSH